MRLTSLAPIVPKDSRLLILGSMPGAISLEKQQYYGNRHNAFWTIISEFTQTEMTLVYAEQIKKLPGAKIALWDVLKHCERKGSLDSAIRPNNIIANDIDKVLRQNPSIQYVLFNGQKAAALFKRHVFPNLNKAQNSVQYATLPSTSPANARISRLDKNNAWQKYLLKCVTK